MIRSTDKQEYCFGPLKIVPTSYMISSNRIISLKPKLDKVFQTVYYRKDHKFGILLKVETIGLQKNDMISGSSSFMVAMVFP